MPKTSTRSAKRAGRPYPNLVDNMKVASAKRSSGRKKKTAKRAASKRSRS